MPNNTSSKMNPVVIGAGAIAVAAASYYLFGPEGKHHRKQAKGWMIKAKGEIVEKLEEAKEMSEPIYHSIIDTVVANYTNKASVTKEELAEFADRIKGQWKQISTTSKKSNGKRRMSKSKK